MKSRNRLGALSALILSMCMAFLSGCNTIKGAGQDVEAVGDEIEEEAVENRPY